MELSPGNFRTFVVGTSYQLGNLVSSASSTIEATIGERYPLPPLITEKGPESRYNYGKVICKSLPCTTFPSRMLTMFPSGIFLGCVYVFVIAMTFVGPEAREKSFDPADDKDLKDIVGAEAVERIVQRGDADDGAWQDRIEQV